MSLRLPALLSALTLAALFGCRADAPASPIEGDDERLFARARSCDPSSPDCARLRAEATGRATRRDAETRAPRAKTFSFATP